MVVAYTLNPTTQGQNSNTVPNQQVCIIEKSQTILTGYYKNLLQLTYKGTNFQCGQEQRAAFATASKLFSMHETLANIEPETLIMDIMYIGDLATGNSS